MTVITGFLRTRAARRWVPLGISLGVHACLIVVLVWAFSDYSAVKQQANDRVKVADAVLIEGAPIGTVRSGPDAAPAELATQLIAPAPQRTAAAQISHPDLARSFIAGATGAGQRDMPIASGNSVNSFGALARIGVEESPAGPRSQFMGISGDAIRIAFVCDASGSMMDRMPQLKEQLENSINQLQPVQWFNVIFFQDGNAVAANPRGLIQGMPGNCQRIEKLIDHVSAMGNSNPMTAIDLAFSQNAQVIYLLTDGDFQDVPDSITDEKIVEQIRKLNSSGRVRVNTILFISNVEDLQSEDARGGREVLQKIARENGGTFKVVLAEGE